MRYTKAEKASIAFVLAFVLTMAAIFVGGLFDWVQEYRAFDKRTDCTVQRMIPLRKPLTTHVTCAPAIQRQDTTTVQIGH